MTRYQFFLLPTLAAAVLALSGAFNQKKAESSSGPPASPIADDPEAMATLDRALVALSAERLASFETTVWQLVRCEDFAYQACGRMVMGPGDRARFDLNVQVGSTLAQLHMVNDGQTLWKSMRIGAGQASIQRFALPALGEVFKSSMDAAQARLKLLEEHGMAGPAATLRGLRQHVQNAMVRQEQWQGRTVLVVSGMWPRDDAAWAAQPENVRQRCQMRQCRVFLDAETAWPYRIEWWGAEKVNGPNQLLAETEYREPVLNQRFTAERLAAEFTFVAE